MEPSIDNPVDAAAAALVKKAGRPEALWWEHLSEHEREGWREMVRTVLYTHELAVNRRRIRMLKGDEAA